MEEYHRQVKKYLPGGVHHNFDFPWREVSVHSVRSKDTRIWDMNGTEYLDLFAYRGSMILGHGNKEHNSMLRDVMESNMCVSHTNLELETMELLHEIFPMAEMMRFGVSATMLLQDAIRLSKSYTGRNKIVRFEHQYLESNDGEESYVVAWNSLEALEQLLKQHENEIACVLMEPICISYGSIEPEQGYLKAVRRICDGYGVLLVFDEVNTGIRAGYGGAQNLYDVKADLMVLGKAIGGGMPVGVLAGKKEIMCLYQRQKVIQGGDHNGYPLGMAAIMTTLKLLFQGAQKNYQLMNKQAQKLKDITLEVSKETDFPIIIQGPALCCSIHCSSRKLETPSDYTQKILAYDVFLNGCLQRNGILVETPLTIYSNLSLSDSDLELYRNGLRKAVEEAKEILEE